MHRKYTITLLCLFLPLCLIGCATPSIVTKPLPIDVTRWRTQPVPAELLRARECPAAESLVTTGDIVAAYQKCWSANAAQNADKAAIRGLNQAAPASR